MAFAVSNEAVQKFMDACGFKATETRKIVVVLEVGQPARIYSEGYCVDKGFDVLSPCVIASERFEATKKLVGVDKDGHAVYAP